MRLLAVALETDKREREARVKAYGLAHGVPRERLEIKARLHSQSWELTSRGAADHYSAVKVREI